MADRKEGSKEFSVKGGITGLSGGKFVGIESQRLPGGRGTLLQDSTNVGIRGISCQRKDSGGTRMMKGNSRGQKGF